MNIYIMSRGRAGKVNTLKWIPEEWRKKTVIVISYGEYHSYNDLQPGAQLIEAPLRVTNYSQKFQWILDGLPEWDQAFSTTVRYGDKNEKALIMDDDLVFSQRIHGRLISIKDPEVVGPMFHEIEAFLDSYALVGVHPRQMGQNAKQPYEQNGRIICIQGINRAKIGIPIKVDQYPILADVVLNCTLLARGQPNSLLTTFFQDHGPCQAPGGCSIYRTPVMQREAVEYLAKRFPGFVKAVMRKTNDQWLASDNGERYDYTCQWKKLFNAGIAHILDPGKAPNPDKEGAGATEAVV